MRRKMSILLVAMFYYGTDTSIFVLATFIYFHLFSSKVVNNSVSWKHFQT